MFPVLINTLADIQIITMNFGIQRNLEKVVWGKGWIIFSIYAINPVLV